MSYKKMLSSFEKINKSNDIKKMITITPNQVICSLVSNIAQENRLRL